MAERRPPRHPRRLHLPQPREHRHDGSRRGPRDTLEPVRRPVIATIGDIVEPELCADMALEAMAEGRFVVLPHPRVGESFVRKANDDDDRWLEGTNRRLRTMHGEM
jgi:hypothetical protein